MKWRLTHFRDNMTHHILHQQSQVPTLKVHSLRRRISEGFTALLDAALNSVHAPVDFLKHPRPHVQTRVYHSFPYAILQISYPYLGLGQLLEPRKSHCLNLRLKSPLFDDCLRSTPAMFPDKTIYGYLWHFFMFLDLNPGVSNLAISDRPAGPPKLVMYCKRGCVLVRLERKDRRVSTIGNDIGFD